MHENPVKRGLAAVPKDGRLALEQLSPLLSRRGRAGARE